MPKPWIWFVVRGFVTRGFVAVSLALATAGTAAAAVSERTITHTIRDDGSVLEATRLAVRLDSMADVERWSPYFIALDENRELVRLEASSTGADGKTRRLGKGEQDLIQVPYSSELATSAKLKKLGFPPLPPGSRLALDYEVRSRPYFPAGIIGLTNGEAVDSLRVEVRGGRGFRFRIDGPTAGLTVEPLEDGVRVTAQALPKADPPELAPGEAGDGPVLRYAWGDGRDWPAVGRWYESLTSGVPRHDEAVRAKARELAGDASDPRERLGRLTEFVQQKVRYVSVQMGIGGYRPFAPKDVLANRWGDCKGKAFLLLDLLHEVGIEAYPALILAGGDERVDAEFPAPSEFNHLIVAVPRSALGNPTDDPGAGAYLFVDPTLERGGASWIHPSTQEQQALVVRGERSELVRTPSFPAAERVRISANLAVQADGRASGGAALELTGSHAASVLELLASRPADEIETSIRALFSRLLPGVTIGSVTYQPDPDTRALPAASFTATLGHDNFLLGESDVRSLAVPAFPATPEPRDLGARQEPVVLEPLSQQVEIKIHLPPGWSLVESQSQQVENATGAFRTSVSQEGAALVVSRSTVLAHRFVEPDAVPLLKELALAEHRALKRQVRVSRAPAAP